MQSSSTVKQYRRTVKSSALPPSKKNAQQMPRDHHFRNPWSKLSKNNDFQWKITGFGTISGFEGLVVRESTGELYGQKGPNRRQIETKSRTSFSSQQILKKGPTECPETTILPPGRSKWAPKWGFSTVLYCTYCTYCSIHCTVYSYRVNRTSGLV